MSNNENVIIDEVNDCNKRHRLIITSSINTKDTCIQCVKSNLVLYAKYHKSAHK
jgi:hypothetical protein